MNDNYKEEKVIEHCYHDVFTTQYNIGVAPPMKDTCSVCDLANAQIARLKADGKDRHSREKAHRTQRKSKGSTAGA